MNPRSKEICLRKFLSSIKGISIVDLVFTDRFIRIRYHMIYERGFDTIEFSIDMDIEYIIEHLNRVVNSRIIEMCDHLNAHKDTVMNAWYGVNHE